MRILMFGETYLPPAYLPRVRYFCAYFLKKGWDVTLIYEASGDENYTPEGFSTFPVNYYKHKKGIGSRIEWGCKFIAGLLFDHKGKFFYNQSKAFLKGKEFDLVFCSSCFTFPLTSAARAAKERNIPLFVDLRDIAEQSPDDNYYMAHTPPKYFGNLITAIYKKISLKRRNKVLKAASGVTTVSPFHVKTLSSYNSNTKLIYNGFDETKFTPENRKTEYFTISYFGRVYNEQMRNPRLLFAAVRNLRKKNILSPENTVIKWFVDENSQHVIEKIVKEYGLEDFTEYHGFIMPDELSSEMNKSSVFLVLCNVETEKRFFGIMTTKYFEALGTNRPVLCIPDINDDLSRIIQETHSGLVSSDVSEVENFLLEKFTEWQQTGCTKGTLDETIRMDFSRQKGAEILEELFEKTLKQRQ